MPKGAWHTQWQERFPQREVKFRAAKNDAACPPFRDRRADALAHRGRTVVEFQKSPISNAEVGERHRDYVEGHGLNLIWIVHGPRTRLLPVSRTVLLCFDEDAWKYKEFMGHAEYVYYDCDGIIYRARPDAVRSHMLHVRGGVPAAAFVDALLQPECDDSLWSPLDLLGPLPQCTLYHNQRGAGCGKTYESIQLLAGRDERFQHVRQFVYLTLVHCAKTVIFNEYLSQLRQGVLGDICEPEVGGASLLHGEVVGKQYRITFRRASDSANVSVIIGTIDSFMYALGDKRSASQRGGDFFAELRASISAGFRAYNDGGVARYARGTMRLSRECLVIVDEAQDLERSYVESLAAIMRDTYVDVYLIGDKLQSIWRAENVFTYLQSEDLPETNAVFNTGDNVVRRFHDPGLADFVNPETGSSDAMCLAVFSCCKLYGTIVAVRK